MAENFVRIENIDKRGSNAIDKLGLGDKVLTLRRNLTLEEVTDRVNRIKPKDAPKISISQVSKYCVTHGVCPGNQAVSRLVKSIPYNSLEEAIEVKERVVRHVKKLERVVDKVKDDKEKLSEIASISNAYLSSCKCLLDVNKAISNIEKEYYGHERVRKVLKALLDTLEIYPEVKTKFFEKLRDSSVYDTIKYI